MPLHGKKPYLDFSLLLAALYVPVAFIGEEETALKALEAMQIQEEDYFCHPLREVVHCALPGASPLLRRPEQQMISVDFQSAPIITG